LASAATTGNEESIKLSTQSYTMVLLSEVAYRQGGAMKITALTLRQEEIARMVAAGLSNRQIAQELGLSEGTVKIHLHKAYKTLGIANRAALAAMVSARARTRAKKSREVSCAVSPVLKEGDG